MAIKKHKKRVTPLSKAVGRRLAQVRKHFDYNSYTMADVMGIRIWAYLSNEKGNHLPLGDSLWRLADKLGISLDWLLTGRGQMFFLDEEKPTLGGAEKRESDPALLLNSELAEMKYVMRRVPLVRHSVMAFYQEFKLKHGDFISQELSRHEQPPPTRATAPAEETEDKEKARETEKEQ